MPYISIKAYPRDDAIKNRLAEEVNRVFMEVLGCPQEAITISVEDIDPADWEEKVEKPEIRPNMDKMKILDGVKKY